MDSDRLLTCHDYADATGASGLRRAVLLTLTGCALTFGQWTQVTAPGQLRQEATASPVHEAVLTSLAIQATPPSRSRRRRTPKTAATTGAPA